MNSNTANVPSTYTTPLTLRVYDALPGNPFWIGIGFTFGLLFVFFVGRALIEGANNSYPGDLRVAIIHILQTAYSASAYAYLLMTARKTAHDLSPVDRQSPQWQTIVDSSSKHSWWVLLLVGATTYLFFGVVGTNVTTAEPVNPWDWHWWSYDVYWHRATTVLNLWWTGCLCYVIVAESRRLSHLSDGIESIDLLDLLPYQPLIRLGLTNALLLICWVSIMSLLGFQSRYIPILAVIWLMFVGLARMGMMLPLSGIRRKIRVAIDQELDWCRQALKIARDEMKSDASKQQSIAEIVAYKSLVENTRIWPFDNPTLVRFTLYIMIPLGSWLGSAFVERGLDLFLS
jgi:hypothetical protein